MDNARVTPRIQIAGRNQQKQQEGCMFLSSRHYTPRVFTTDTTYAISENVLNSRTGNFAALIGRDKITYK